MHKIEKKIVFFFFIIKTLNVVQYFECGRTNNLLKKSTTGKKIFKNLAMCTYWIYFKLNKDLNKKKIIPLYWNDEKFDMIMERSTIQHPQVLKYIKNFSKGKKI